MFPGAIPNRPVSRAYASICSQASNLVSGSISTAIPCPLPAADEHLEPFDGRLRAAYCCLMTLYRNPATVAAMWVGMVTLACFAVVADLTPRILLCGGVMLLATLGLRPRLTTDESGVQVVNLRTTCLDWDDIYDVRFGSRLGIARLVLVTSSRSIPSWAVSVGRAGGRAWCIESCQTIQHQWRTATGRSPSEPL